MPRPVDPGTLQNLLAQGVDALKRGRPAAAEAPLREALRLAPQAPEIAHLLAVSLGQTGRSAEAVRHIERALRRDAGRAAYNETHGNILRELGQSERAIEAYRRAVRLDPRLVGAHINLGALLLAAGQMEAAVTALDAALKLAPKTSAVRVLLARALQGMGDIEAAERVLFAEEIDSDAPAIAAERARLRQVQGRLTDAIACFEQALAARRNAADAAGLAEIHLWRGDADAAAHAIADYRDADAPQIALVRARIALDQRTPPATEGLSAWLDADHNLDPIMQRQLAFCLGDVWHARGDMQRAFGHYDRANRTAAAPFHARAHRAFVDRLIEFYSNARTTGLPRAEPIDVAPLFIVGMPRSGTTLIEQVLGRHPQIAALGERADVGRAFHALAAPGPWTDGVSALDRGQLNALAARYRAASELGATPDVRWMTDKMPVNFLYLGLIAQLFPGATVLHCRRDPVAIALSCFRQDFRDPALSFSQSLDDLARYMADYERLMRHWSDVLPLPMLEVVYEDVVQDLEGQTRRILAALALDFDARCLTFDRAERFANTASHAQVRRPLYRAALDRHQRYASQLAPFTLALERERAELGL